MTMDNLRDDTSGNTTNTSQREYTSITQQEFEEFLTTTKPEWKLVDDASSNELVYHAPVDCYRTENIVLRIYSSIDERTGSNRNRGQDAIRLLVFKQDTDQLIGGESKTLRIKTWEKNLHNKITSLWNNTSQYITSCNECGSVMVVRDGPYGKFYGCTEYPDCENKKNIN